MTKSNKGRQPPIAKETNQFNLFFTTSFSSSETSPHLRMSSITNNVKLENPLANAPSSVQWEHQFELGYDEPKKLETICFFCGGKGKPEQSLSKCGKCKVASYCSRDCQIKDWKEGRHRMACQSYLRLASLDKDEVRSEIYRRIRFYACPYAVFKTQELGNGFLFIQSNNSLRELSLMLPRDESGRTLERSILMHFLTLGEFDAEVISDDFEMAAARSKLKELIQTYDKKTEVPLLFRLRCGHVALGKAVLVPDYNICKKLGEQYYAETSGAIQLNLDDL